MQIYRIPAGVVPILAIPCPVLVLSTLTHSPSKAPELSMISYERVVTFNKLAYILRHQSGCLERTIVALRPNIVERVRRAVKQGDFVEDSTGRIGYDRVEGWYC